MVVRASAAAARRLWLPTVIVAVWWLATASAGSLYFPTPGKIIHTFVHVWFSSKFVSDFLPSIRNLCVGFTAASILGIVGGILLGSVRWLARAVEPIVHFFRSLPPPALLPIALVILGTGVSMKVGIIVAGAIWPTLLNTIDGVAGVDSQFHAMGTVYSLSRKEKLFNIILPAASPQIAAGMRTTLQISIILIVVSEMVASTGGIGYQVLLSQQTFAIAQTWADTVLLGLVGYVANLIFVSVEAPLLAWHAGLHNANEG